MRVQRNAFLALVTCLALLGAACSSGSDTTSSDDPPASESDAGDAAVEDPPADEPDTAAPGAGGPVDPEQVRQVAGILTGTEIESATVTCLLEDADGDSQLTDVYTGVGTPGYQVTPEGFTALAVSVHGCADNSTLSTSLVSLSGATDVDGITEYTSCVSAQIAAEPNGDLAYTGLAALAIGFPVPEGAQETAATSASECIAPESIANQLSSTREQIAGFAVEVDRECVVAGIDEQFVQTFWADAVSGGSDTSQQIDGLLDPCTEDFDSGLPTELPADFEPWAGSGALAGVDPAARVGAYTDAPPNQLEDGVDYRAVLTTDDGEIVIDLYEEAAPITVNSFVSLARDGYYDGTRFHRVLEGFMAQGGDPSGTGSGGPGYSFADEQSGLTAVDQRGLLAMANSGPDTNGSQFFITFAPATHLNGLHTVFGEIVEGDDVFELIDRRDPGNPTSRGEELISVVITES